jgi:hypothetical protein
MRHTQLTSDGGVVLHPVVTREARKRMSDAALKEEDE